MLNESIKDLVLLPHLTEEESKPQTPYMIGHNPGQDQMLVSPGFQSC